MNWRVDAIVLALIVAATVATFAPVSHHAFVDYDDGLFVYANPHVLRGLSRDGLAYAFTSWEHRIWAPLTYLSHMADVQAFGVHGETLGLPASGWHHLTNLALHVACTVLLYVLLRSATRRLWPCALVAALFALHPLHVESVAWISERKTLLSTLFGLTCLLAYLRYARRPAAGPYLVALALLALGLMSKPMLVSWPLLLLLLDWWPLERIDRSNWRRRLVEKLPFVALVAASSVVTYVAQRPAMHLMTLVPLGYRLQNAAVSCATYVVEMFAPTGLAALYPYRASIPASHTAAALALLVGATVAALRCATRFRWLAVGWFWFVCTLVPVSGLVQVGNHARADRYTYVPLIGLFIVVAWAGAELLHRVRALRAPAAVAAVLVLAACGALSQRQARTWSDTETLFRHTCAATDPNGEAHNNLARALVAQDRTDEAIAEYREALRMLPRYVEARIGLGDALASQGRDAEAMREWREAVRIQPKLGSEHAFQAAALLERGRVDDAIAEYELALRSDPGDAATLNNLATALARAGRLDEAIERYRAALDLRPDLVPSRVFLGRALALRGRAEEAVIEFEEAARLEPWNPEVLVDLARAYAGVARLEEALATAETARRLAQSAGSPELVEESGRLVESCRLRLQPR